MTACSTWHVVCSSSYAQIWTFEEGHQDFCVKPLGRSSSAARRWLLLGSRCSCGVAHIPGSNLQRSQHHCPCPAQTQMRYTHMHEHHGYILKLPLALHQICACCPVASTLNPLTQSISAPPACPRSAWSPQATPFGKRGLVLIGGVIIIAVCSPVCHGLGCRLGCSRFGHGSLRGRLCSRPRSHLGGCHPLCQGCVAL